MKKQIPLLFMVLALMSSVYSQTGPLPKIVVDGLETYKKVGYGKAFDVWFTGSPLEKDVATKVSMTAGMAQVEVSYGKLVGYEYVGVVSFAPTVKRYYFILLYEKGPLYVWFEVYSREGREIIPSFDYNTKASLILPKNLIEKK